MEPLLGTTLGPEYQVTVQSNREAIKRALADGLCDVLVLDLDSSYSAIADQLSFFHEIRDSGVPVVVMTDDDSRSTAKELVQLGVYDYFRKPPVLQELKIIVRRAHEHATLKRELETAQRQLHSGDSVVPAACDQLIGSSARSRRVYELIHRVADINSFVLITGESGTGKELIARAIHNVGHRAKQPFVAVSCGAIPETLIEAELFGHEKGAFTGAGGARAGYLEQAGEGTVFLDEIGELSLSTQVKLLRVLQQREFTRLGSARPVPLRARVLFATHRDLAQMVEAGTFRQDFYYRVNVMRISAPALREHPEDIPELAQHFVQMYAPSCNRRVRGIHPSAVAMLLEYPWPGNVRELENVLQTAIIMAESDIVTPEDLPEVLREAIPATSESHPSGSFEEQLREYRVRLATKALNDCNGNKTLAARTLNISRAYLHRLLREDGDGSSAVA